MKLIIKQPNTSENVSSDLIDLLASFLKNGSLTQDSELSGALLTNSVYQDSVELLTDRFQNLTITAISYYIRFADSNVLKTLLSANIGDGIGISSDAASNANIGTIFENNSDIVSFDEFKYFTKNNTNTVYKINNCPNLVSIDLSECTNYPGQNFMNLPKLEYFNGSNSESGVLSFPEGTTTIGYYNSFNNLPKLKHIIFPSTMRSFSQAFTTCPNIESVTLNPGFETFGSNSFNSGGNGKLIISDLNAFFNIQWAEAASFKNFFYQCPYFYLKDNNGDLTEITSVTIPQSSLTIRGAIFWQCKSLRSVIFHSDITTIGREAFSQCTNLTGENIELPNLTVLERGAFDNCRIVSFTDLGSITAINENTFSVNSSLTTVYIPSTVTNIKESAFKDCTSLAKFSASSAIGELSLPNLSTIGVRAFNGCISITSVTNLGTITSIAGSAFERCSGLQSIIIPNTVVTIGAQAFANDSALASISIPNNVTTIQNNAFTNCSNLSRVDITDIDTFVNITFSNSDSNPVRKAKHLFINGQESLTHYTFPAGTTTIKPMVLQGIYSLQQVTIPSGVTELPNGLFYYNENLSTVVIPSTVTSIGNWCFEGCSALTSLSIPSSVASIGQAAFWGCNGLTRLDITNLDNFFRINVSTDRSFIKQYWYLYLNNTMVTGTVTLPSDTPQNNYKFTYLCGINEIIFPSTWTEIPQCMCQRCNDITTLNIPSNIRKIGQEAFGYCTNIASITLNEGLQDIGYYAFQGASITSLVIPSTVTKLSGSYGCVDRCSQLQELVFLGTTAPTIEQGSLMYGTPNTCKIYVPDESIASYTAALNVKNSGLVSRLTPMSQRPNS